MTQIPRFTLRQLEIFISVARHSSVTRAAEQLHLTQPAVTRAIQEIETEIGQQLFDRAPRGMSLTVFGETLLRHSKAIMAELRQAAEQLGALQGRRTGSLIIGTTPLGAAASVPDALLQMVERYPGVELSVVEESYNGLLAMLCAGELDLVVGPKPEGVLDTQLESSTLFEDDLVVVSRPGGKPARDERTVVISLDNPGQRKWVLPHRGNGLWREVTQHFGSLEPNVQHVIVQTNSMAVLKRLVISGGFLTVLPRQIVSTEIERGQLEEIAKLPGAKWELLMIWRSTKVPSPAMMAVREILSETAWHRGMSRLAEG